MEEVGTYLLYKSDQRLFRRYTNNACKDTLYKCEFADNVALMTATRAAAETDIQAYYSEAENFGLTVDLSKTKFLVVGHEV